VELKRENRDYLRLVTVYTCHSTSLGQLVTGWKTDNELPSIFHVVRQLSTKDKDQGQSYIQNEFFRKQDREDAKYADKIRFSHLLEMAAAQRASVMTSVRLVEANLFWSSFF
jgi:hypothetical protein